MAHALNLYKAEEKPWYSKGLRFKCTGCGECCTGAPGYVWVSKEEIIAMAELLQLSVDKFSKKYIRQVGGRHSLIEDPKTFDCVFLKDKKCTIYRVRPKQCQTFPWWVQNLRSEEDWQKASAYCEGINHPDASIVPCETITDEVNNSPI
ncbi:MAG: YkgJ family cysteine cluster protein [Parachlamydiaceae bacterium]|nr:YkgJ family cysteine cluster protein [Parachlamydiaceae bacterium]